MDFRNWKRDIIGTLSFMAVGILAAGCVSIQIPQYLKDQHPYKKEYFASYLQTLTAVKTVLKNSDWKIANTVDPAVFEATQQNKSSGSSKTLLMTETKQTSMLLFSRYTLMNIYVRSLKNATEVEIRYEVITPFPFKKFRSYRNDGFVNKLFARIQDQVDKK